MLVVLFVSVGCGTDEKAGADLPQVVRGVPNPCRLLPADELEAIADASVTEFAAGRTGVDITGATCNYRYADGGVGQLKVEDATAWRQRYDQERESYESKGIAVPDDEQIARLGDEAILDVRHNELNVRQGDVVLRAELGRRIGDESTGPLTREAIEAELALEEEMIREALTRLED